MSTLSGSSSACTSPMTTLSSAAMVVSSQLLVIGCEHGRACAQRHAVVVVDMCGSVGLPGKERVAVPLVRPRLVLTAATTEGVGRLADQDVDEADLFEHLLPARTGQPASDS